jgi:hypothetical protein
VKVNGRGILVVAVVAASALAFAAAGCSRSEGGGAEPATAEGARAASDGRPVATSEVPGTEVPGTDPPPESTPGSAWVTGAPSASGPEKRLAAEAVPADAAGDGSVPADVPLAKMGRPLAESALVNAPGYVPPDDPEWESVVRGKREGAPPTDAVLEGGYPSADALAAAILDAVNAEDAERLDKMRVTFREFSEIMWPEFPDSRPVVNLPVTEAWGFVVRASLTGARRGVHDWSGKGLRFEGISYADGLMPYTNFSLYKGVRIHATTRGGEPVVVDFVGSFVERLGRWKVYTYKD